MTRRLLEALAASAARAWPCSIAWLLASAPAWASPLFELLGAQEGGFAGRATPSGANAAYFNPALLLDAEQGVSAEYFLLIERLEVTAGARESSSSCPDGACDVPEVNGAGPDSFRHEDGSLLELPTLPTEWLERGRPAGDGDGYTFAPRARQHASSDDEERGYVSVGLVQAPLRDRLAYGLQLLLPLQAFLQTHAFYSDEREQFFSNSLHHELYGDRLDTAELAFGLGALVVDRFALGAGLTLSIAGVARAPTYVPSLADLDTLLIDSDATVCRRLPAQLGCQASPVSQST